MALENQRHNRESMPSYAGYQKVISSFKLDDIATRLAIVNIQPNRIEYLLHRH